MKKVFLLFVMFFIISQKNYGALCKSNGSGNWSDPGTWSCGRVPACGDSIVIAATHNVTLDNNTVANFSGCAASSPVKVIVLGTLSFTNGSKLRLPCGNSYLAILSGGTLTSGSNSNDVIICGTGVWSGPGTVNTPTFFGNPLPVDLLYFKGEEENRQVKLIWATASEQNSHHFEIERSVDALSFEYVNSVNAAGNSQSTLTYSSYDDPDKGGYFYYRLKQVDNNFSYKYYSAIAVCYLECNSTLQVFPNPTSLSNFNVSLPEISDNNARIELINSLGQIVFSYSIPPAQKFVKIQAEGATSKNGLFVLRFNNSGKSFKTVVIGE